MLQPFRIVGRDNADPSDIVEFNIGDDILFMLVFASPQHPGDSTTGDASETTVSSALFESAVLGELSMFPMQSGLTFSFLGVDMRGDPEVLLHVEIKVVLGLAGVSYAVVTSSLHLSCKIIIESA